MATGPFKGRGVRSPSGDYTFNEGDGDDPSVNANDATLSAGGGGLPADLLNVDLLDDISKAVVYTQYGSSTELYQLYNSNKISADQKDKEGCTILQWASINNRIDIAKFLMEEGAKVNETGGVMKENALQWATRQGHLEMVQLLIAFGADADHLNVHGQDTVFLAVQNQRPEVALFLIAQGQRSDNPDLRGYTPLMWVCHYSPRNITMLRLLLALGGRNSINQQDVKNGNTALHLAVMTSASMSVMDALVEAGANFEQTNQAGFTPLNMTDEDGNPFPSQKFLTELTKTHKKEGIPLAQGFFLPYFQLCSAYLSLFFFGWLWGICASVFVIWLQSKFCIQIALNPANLYAMGLNAALITFIFGSFLVYTVPDAPVVSTIIESSLVMAIVIFLYKANVTDPGSPSDTSFSEQSAMIRQMALEGRLKISDICPTCILEKKNGLHHCPICHKCIERFDHHCPWIGNCVGRKNHRYFIGFLFFTCVALANLLAVTVNQMKMWCGTKGGFSEVQNCLLYKMQAPFTLSFSLAVIVMCWVGALLCSQLWEVGRGVTTYDVIKETRHFQQHASTMFSQRATLIDDSKTCCKNLCNFMKGIHEVDKMDDDLHTRSPFLPSESGMHTSELPDDQNMMKMV